MSTNFEFIDSFSDLERLGKRLSKERVIAVDIEADSLHHYAPKICLIQISTLKDTFIVDPLATKTIEPLSPLLSGREIKKVFHGADYDLRSLLRDFGTALQNIFDTMIASQFLGEKEVGLAAVLKTRFGVILNKKYQKADWSKRPITHDMLLYAAADTHYLVKLYHELERELKRKSRLDWVKEECDILSVECATPNNTHWTCRPGTADVGLQHTNKADEGSPLFRRFKGAGTMPPRDLAILEKLLAFRDRRARKQDRPPFKLFGNNLIKELVKAKPASRRAIENIPGLPRNFMKQYAKEALSAISKGIAVPKHRLPVYPKKPRPRRDPKKQDRMLRLKTWRDIKAKDLDLEPGVLCNNALLDAVAALRPESIDGLEAIPAMRQWQKRLFGQEIIRVVQDDAGKDKHT